VDERNCQRDYGIDQARDGGGVRWAIVCSLIATAKLNNVEPYAWLSDVLQRMTDGHPASRLDELLPWNWRP
jgi:transposase